MSLLINDMDMPKNCMECELRFIARGLDTECIFSNDTVDDCTDRRLYRCPLVEIPTLHGRLIDAEALMISVLDAMKNKTDDSVIGLIDKAPTIIEAEVSE